LLLTGLPANYLSPSALPVSTWLSQSSGSFDPVGHPRVILVASSSIGGVTSSLIERWEKSREIAGKLKQVLAPLVVAVVTPGVFIVLITLLSLPGSGGFQTSLTSDPSHVQAVYMLGSSILLTTFVHR